MENRSFRLNLTDAPSGGKWLALHAGMSESGMSSDDVRKSMAERFPGVYVCMCMYVYE